MATKYLGCSGTGRCQQRKVTARFGYPGSHDVSRWAVFRKDQRLVEDAAGQRESDFVSPQRGTVIEKAWKGPRPK
jgi:hypothetical protein